MSSHQNSLLTATMSAVRTSDADVPEGTDFAGLDALDRMQEAWLGQMTGGTSPGSWALAFLDWSFHLAAAPGKRLELALKAQRKFARLASHLFGLAIDPDTPPAIEPLQGDNRFRDEAWKRMPYSLWSQAFLLQQQWWHNATHDVPGVAPHHEDVVSFAARQILDTISPSNMAFTNPVVISRMLETSGLNFLEGFRNLLEDLTRLAAGRPPVGAEGFRAGIEVAATPGKVVFRNDLIELIQYAPTTPSVFSEPVLIVPAWIMKYYILDLSHANSLVRYLVSKGHTVFCISWRNPTEADRNVSFDDYRRLGVMAALDAIETILPERKVHAAGYCLGGTLLAIAAAAMAESGDSRLGSLTLLAAQTDFSEPGELALFIDHSQMNMLASMMWNRGYLSADQMAGAFQLLRSNDLFWSRIVHEYMMGERPHMNDLMAWNADTTRMPYRMHSEYLQKLYLDNALAAGRLIVDGQPIALQNIGVPLFVVGTERDHVAPWRSVYKIHYVTRTDVTFVLTSGGHNAGIVSEPGHPRRAYRISTRCARAPLLSADEWIAENEETQGSWWAAWTQWLAGKSNQDRTPPPQFGSRERGLPPICDAPGTYVHQR